MAITKIKRHLQLVFFIENLSPKAQIFSNFLSWSKLKKKKVLALLRGHGQAKPSDQGLQSFSHHSSTVYIGVVCTNELMDEGG